MKVEIDVNGGTNYVHVGTSQMMSVPYALYAENVHNLNMDSILGAVYDSINTSFASGAMSVSTFGDTLTLNGQSIIVPGLSYQNVVPTFGSVTDASGNTYQTLQYGSQEWMAENLRTENFANGDAIPVISGSYTSSNYPPSWSWADNNKNIGLLGLRLETCFGWPIQVEAGHVKANTFLNWPMQAHGAEMMRIACAYANAGLPLLIEILKNRGVDSALDTICDSVADML